MTSPINEEICQNFNLTGVQPHHKALSTTTPNHPLTDPPYRHATCRHVGIANDGHSVGCGDNLIQLGQFAVAATLGSQIHDDLARLSGLGQMRYIYIYLYLYIYMCVCVCNVYIYIIYLLCIIYIFI